MFCLGRRNKRTTFYCCVRRPTETKRDSALKEHCERLNANVAKAGEDVEKAKEQVATLTRRLEKSRSQNAKLVEQLKESVKSSTENFDSKAEDNEMRDAELGELRKVRRDGGELGGSLFTLNC